jgi:transposase
MAMGTRRHRQRQEKLWIATEEISTPVSHPFYARLNEILDEARFDEFVERQCQKFYADKMGRPSLAPGMYFRLLVVGYLEGIDSERGIAWRTDDSLSLRKFLGIGLDEKAPDHSTISRTRRLINLETHQSLFRRVLEMIAEHGLLKGKTVGVDATTLEANAAMRSIVRRDNGESYEEFLTRLAKESGIETPTREQLAKLDRQRKKRTSNDEWFNPNDPDAKVAKMKDGSTHMAHKAEHAVDLETGALIAVTVQCANLGDTSTIYETLGQAGENLTDTAEAVNNEDEGELVKAEGPEEIVTDKGYHSNDVLKKLEEAEVRSYIPEPDRGRRNWDGKEAEKKAVYGNRRRVRGKHGKSLLKRRGEYLERSFAHLYETGGMRRIHLRGHANIEKRLLIQGSAFNLSLILRQETKVGTPRGFQSGDGAFFAIIFAFVLPFPRTERFLHTLATLTRLHTSPGVTFSGGICRQAVLARAA